MSFVIAVYVNEGIVLASDRRTTYNNFHEVDGKRIETLGIHTTDNTDKTFLCPNGAGISLYGAASYRNKPITGFIQDMIRTQIKIDTEISDIPQIIMDYFYGMGEVPDTQFIVAGYNGNEKSEQLVYQLNLRLKRIDKIDTSGHGATWGGEGLTLARLLQQIAIQNDKGEYEPIPNEEILWRYFTLQDAVDFARYAIETTINTMHFKNMLETVGGDIDILIITKDETKWLQKKEIQ